MAKKRKSHITLPRSYDPGPGYPRETLAYLSEAEHELIRKLTDGKWNRGPKGVRSYADDSASSKGVSRGDNSGTKGSGGLGQGGQGSGGSAGSKSGGSSGASSSSSSSASKSSSSGSSSSSSSSSSGAGRDSSRGIGQGAGGSAIGRGGASTATGKAAEAAKANAARGGAVSNPVSMSGALDSGYYHSFTNSLPGMANPTRFDNTIRPTNMVTAAHVPVDTWSKRYNANALSPGAQKIHQAIVDNAFRTNTPVDFFSGRSPRSSGTLQHPLGQAIDVRLKDPVTGAFVGTPQIGALAANPIGNVRPLMGRSNKVASAIQGALEKPYREFAKGVLNSFMDNPGVYGDFNNQRWGGSFGGTWGKDYMHYDEGKITSAVNADQAALRKEAANYRGPGAAGGTMLAGSLTNSVFSGGAAPTQVAGIANGGLTQAAAEARAKKATTGLDAIQKAATPPSAFASDPRLGVPQGALPAAPLRSTAGTYTTPYNPEVQGPLRYGGPLDKIPTPNSTGYATLMTPAFAADPRLSVPQGSYPAAPPKSAFASDPRLSVPQGSYPAAKPPSAFAADPRLSIPQGAYPAAKPPSAFAADPRLGVPQGAYPAAPKAPSFVNNERSVAPGHWKREEDNYLTQLGVYDAIQRDKYAKAGYDALQNPDGSGLMINPGSQVPGRGGSFNSKTNELSISPDLPARPAPDYGYGYATWHELGHAGSHALGTFGPDEEAAQSLSDIRQFGIGTGAGAAAGNQLQKGDMSYLKAGTSPRDYNPLSSVSTAPVGAFPAARQPSQVSADPRVSQTPPGAFPAAQRPASVFAEDPRIATTPLGSLPAAKPKEIQLAWNVPPMGGALPGQAAWGLGLWGTNRPLPTGPGAQPGTIHSQTADATSAPPALEDKPSFWQQAGDLYNTASTAAKEKVEEIKQDPGFKFAQKYPRLAEFALKMMMGGGGTPNPNGFGNPQDRSGYVTRPQPPQAPQMAQAQGGVSTDPLTILTNLQANMIAQGASPEELAYVQSIIDELTNSQVA